MRHKILVLLVAGQAGVSPTFTGSTATSGQSANAPGLPGTAAGRPGRAGRSGPHPRTGRGQHHLTVHSNQSPAPLSTGMQMQQPVAAAASRARHRQHPRQQQQSLNVVEPDSAVQQPTGKVWDSQQQVQLLQRSAGSRHDQDNTVPQAPYAPQPGQTGAGERSPQYKTLYLFLNCCKGLQKLSGHKCT